MKSRSWLSHCGSIGALLIVFSLVPSWRALGDTVVWGGGNGDWFDAAKWTRNQIPASTDDVTIPTGSNVSLTNSTPQLASLLVAGNVTCANWETQIAAIDITIANGGIVRHTLCDTNAVPGNTNRVYIVCDNLSVESGGAINVNDRGYPGAPASVGDPDYFYGQGPGGGYRKGGGHGGEGGDSYYYVGYKKGGQPYGSAETPAHPGSGGGNQHQYAGAVGGGVIRIVAANTVTIDGAITANGKSTNSQGCGGGGGSIHISCASLRGQPGAQLTAMGGNGSLAPGGGGGGGGGRIAIYYQLIDTFYGERNVRGGDDLSNHPGGPGTLFSAYTGTDPRLTITGAPATYGTPGPLPYGISAVASGVLITNSLTPVFDVSPGFKRTCIGFTLSTNGVVYLAGSEPTVTFTMPPVDATLTWSWTNLYELTVVDAPGGLVDHEASGFYTNASIVQISATATGQYSFAFWSGDIPEAKRNDNPASITIDQPRTIQANYESDEAQTRIWNGTGSWSTPGNWNPIGSPGQQDAVIVASGTIVIDGSVTVASLIVSNSASISFSGWNSALRATEVALADSATVTHANCDILTAPNNTNRVYIVCSNLTVAATATINVNYCGYRGGGASPTETWGQGPGGSLKTTGGSYGGLGAYGYYTPNTRGPTYGSPTGHALPGSGGGGHAQNNPGTEGGGAVQIEASGTITLHGTITANGLSKRNFQGGCGSGGGVYLKCRAFAGTGGKISAEGGGNGSHFSHGGSGGGGRVVIIYDAAAQAAINNQLLPTITISASQGNADNSYNGQPGTIHLSDTSFFPQVGQTLYGGHLLSQGFTSLSCDNLNIAGGQVVFPPDFQLSVAHDVNVSGDGGGIILTNSQISIGGDIVINSIRNGATTFYGGDAGSGLAALGGSVKIQQGFFNWHCPPNGLGTIAGNLYVARSAPTYEFGGFTWLGAANIPSTLQVNGSCMATNGGLIDVVSGPTNELAAADGWGAQLNVAGGIVVASNSTMRLTSDPYNGGPPVVRAHNITVAAGGTVTANATGYAGSTNDKLNYAGFGPGHGTKSSGGSYGGVGGLGNYSLIAGSTYGTRIPPLHPGSGGGYHANIGGAGGGLVWLEAQRTITINGNITANGGAPKHVQGGAGSGGGIQIRCRFFVGDMNASLQANGGNVATNNYANGGPGGGGRIAVVRRHHLYEGTVSVEGGAGYPAENNVATAGTIEWLEPPQMGSVILLR